MVKLPFSAASSYDFQEGCTAANPKAETPSRTSHENPNPISEARQGDSEFTITAPLRLLTRGELAVAVNVSPRTVQEMVSNGEIPVVRIRGAVRFYLPDVVLVRPQVWQKRFSLGTLDSVLSCSLSRLTEAQSPRLSDIGLIVSVSRVIVEHNPQLFPKPCPIEVAILLTHYCTRS
jgi:excisionase family DNA binding protein